MSLNPAQKKVTELTEGYVICQASAGTGKTHAMIHRVKSMLDRGIDPSRILAFTFTKKAGDELKEKLNKLIGNSAIVDAMSIGTIHSAFFKILRSELPLMDHNYKRMVIIKEWKKKKILKDSFKDLFHDKPDKFKNPQIAELQISLAKNALLTPQALEKYLESFSPIELEKKRWIINMYYEYERRKSAEHLIDFDDMLIKTYGILARFPNILLKWQSRWDYIMVDEFQDTNTAQYEIIKLLCKTHGNLFVVGDIKQAIYEWRGAQTSYISKFAQTFGAETVFLDETYRNADTILGYANRIARIMKEEPIKTSIDGGKVEYLGHFVDVETEAKEVVGNIQSLIKDGEKPKDFKILYRLNSQSRAIEEELIQAEIPYVISGGFSFFDRSEVKDMISYFRIFVDPHNSYEEYKRIFNKPTRMLGKAFVDQFDRHFDSTGSCLKALSKRYSKPYMNTGALRLQETILKFVSLVNKGEHSVSDILMKLRQHTQYDNWLIELKSGTGEEDQTRNVLILENLNELLAMSGRFTKVEKLLSYIEMLKNMRQNRDNIDAVQLMTIHKSKGLEADNVFLIGCSDEILPHSRSSKESERRLLYVAVTRAAERLFISSVIDFQNRILEASPFLYEMNLLNFDDICEEKELMEVEA